MAAIAAIAKANQLLDAFNEADFEGKPELQKFLNDPAVLKGLVQQPHSRIVGVGSRLLTARALQMAWASLLPSWGLTLLYINFHYAMRHFAHMKGFTPLGSEWTTWRTVLGWPGFGLKYAEIIAMLFLDAVIVLIILAAITLLSMVAYALTHPCEFVGKVGYVAAVTIAALGGPAAVAVVHGCVVVSAVSG